MCGRLAIFAVYEEFIEQLPFAIRYGLDRFQPNYNATPSQMLPVLYHPDDGEPCLQSLHWGLIPHWAKDKKIAYKLFNARAETAHEKPSFREAFVRRRALVPVNGWYEWLRQDGDKQPYWHARQDNKLIWLAGLWESWTDITSGESIRSFTILTREACGEAARIHNRMPVVMGANDYANWLSNDLCDKKAVRELMDSQPEMALAVYPVSKAMNKPQLNDPSCIQAVQ